MRETVNIKNVIRIAGAFAAWVMGSGFATGQEIMQFFTGFGYFSFGVLILCLVIILWVGVTITTRGFDHCGDRSYSQTEYFCGRRLGRFYDLYIPVSTFAAFICITSGAGAAMEEYFGLPHYIGALILAAAAFLACASGFQRFVKLAGVIGPLIISFIVFIGVVTVVRDFDGIYCVNEYAAGLSEKKAVPFFWLSAFLYISYNVAGGSAYYTALGKSALTRKEAVLGAALGGTMLVLAIGLLNTAMLVNAESCTGLAIPSLYLAGRISGVLGSAFVVILLLGMFTTSSAVLWTVASSLGKGDRKKTVASGALAAACGFILGLFSFADLIGTIYPIIGTAGLLYILCVMAVGIKKRKKY